MLHGRAQRALVENAVRRHATLQAAARDWGSADFKVQMLVFASHTASVARIAGKAKLFAKPHFLPDLHINA